MNDIQEILKRHREWLLSRDGGERADLCGADLCGANLCDADLRGANLCGADLCGADLRGADLCDADLRGADLWELIGERSHIKSGQVEQYAFTYTSEYLQIGCQRHAISDWWKFDDKTIENMGSGALEFWRKWKPWFQQLIEMSPAKPTKNRAGEDQS